MYNNATEMWDSLKNIYYRDNDARKYNHVMETNGCTQGTKTVQEYYSGFMNLWLEYNSIICEKFSLVALFVVHELQENNMRDQFLMKLRPEFETIRLSLMNRKQMPNLENCVQLVL